MRLLPLILLGLGISGLSLAAHQAAADDPFQSAPIAAPTPPPAPKPAPRPRPAPQPEPVAVAPPQPPSPPPPAPNAKCFTFNNKQYCE